VEARAENPTGGGTAPSPGTITLVRHGEPALSRKIKLSAQGYGRWWGLYEEGGLLAQQSPPPQTIELADHATMLMASIRRRSQDSMRILAPGRAFAVHEDLIEAPLPPPPFPAWLRLSPKKWGFLARFWWWFFDHHQGQESRAQAHRRSDAAADRLIALARQGQNVTVVAHGFFNVMIEKSLTARGWMRTWRQGGYRYWSTRHFQKL
jgi:broad specificity phosphatase PhoE